MKRQELVSADKTATEENNQILELNNIAIGADFSSLTPKNLLNLDNASEEQEPGQTTSIDGQINENMKNAHEQGEKIFISIFKLIACNLWNGKIEDSLEKLGMKHANKA